jgi:hypothetical protein
LNNGDTGRFTANENNGKLLEYDELVDLSAILKRLLADRDLRNKFGRYARTLVQAKFWTWEERMNAELQAVGNLVK